MSMLGFISSINKVLTSGNNRAVDSSDDERDYVGNNRTTSVAAGELTGLYH